MARTTPNLGLTVWNLGTDFFSHGALAADWDALDAHDHSPGRGVPILTAGLANLAVTTPKLADSSVTTIKLADANVTTAKIADANVTTAKIADANVTTTKILDANVTTTKIADANVTTAKIADANVTTAKIADSSTTYAKLATDARNAFLKMRNPADARVFFGVGTATNQVSSNLISGEVAHGLGVAPAFACATIVSGGSVGPINAVCTGVSSTDNVFADFYFQGVNGVNITGGSIQYFYLVIG